MAQPEIIRILTEPDPDDRFYCVGVDKSGNQFMGFVTGAFPKANPYPSANDDWEHLKRWYAVMHLFDIEGNHIRSDIRFTGTTAAGQDEAIQKAIDELASMFSKIDRPGKHDISVKLFSVEHEGYQFGLIFEIGDEGHESVLLQPNDIMFHPPYDGVDYST